MELQALNMWATILGTVIALLSLIFAIWLEWDRVKKRFTDTSSPPGKKSILLKLIFTFFIVGVLLAFFGPGLIKLFETSFEFLSIQNQNTGINITVTDSGLVTEESITIKNNDNQQLSLYDWSVKVNEKNLYTFQQAIIKPGQSIYLHTSTGVDSTTSFHINLPRPILQSGYLITLIDGAGIQRAEYRVP